MEGDKGSMVNQPRVIDPRTVAQLTREAVTSAPDRMARVYPDRTEFERVHGIGAFHALLRAIAYAIGGTYAVGYDRALSAAWRNLVASVQTAVQTAAAEYDTDPDGSLDRAVRSLVAIGEASGAENVRGLWRAASLAEQYRA